MLAFHDLHVTSTLTARDLVTAHPACRQVPHPDGPGHDLSDMMLPEAVRPGCDAAGQLAAWGITTTRGAKPGNLVYVLDGDGAEPGNVQVDFCDRSRNVLVVEPRAKLRCRIRFEGDGHLCVVRAGIGDNVLTLTLRSRNALIVYGRGCSARSLDILAEGPDVPVYVGDDLMASAHVTIRTSDSHGIFDMQTGEVINRPERVVIGPHVWLGQESIVMPGVQVGAGAIVGVRAVVTRDVPPLVAMAGVPARVVREGVSWTRAGQPDASLVAAQRTSPLLA